MPGKIAIHNLQEAREFLDTYFDFHDSEVQNIGDVIAFTFSSSYSAHSALSGRKGTVWVIMHVFASQVDDSIKWEFDLVAENDPQNPYPVIIFGSAEITELL